MYGLFLLDVLQTALVTADAFHWFVFGFGNMITLDDTFINSWDVPFLDAVIATIVQTFYCWRIWILSKSLVFPIFIFLVRALSLSPRFCRILSLSALTPIAGLSYSVWCRHCYCSQGMM